MKKKILVCLLVSSAIGCGMPQFSPGNEKLVTTESGEHWAIDTNDPLWPSDCAHDEYTDDCLHRWNASYCEYHVGEPDCENEIDVPRPTPIDSAGG